MARLPTPMADAIRAAYARGEEDEALEPLVFVEPNGKPVGRIGSRDTVLFYDIRGEREIELTRAFVDPRFDKFPVRPYSGRFITMIEYDRSLPVEVLFPSEGPVADTLAEVVSRHGMRQARVAESEKTAHVGYFFGGKRSELLPGEERFIVPSPAVARYDRVPAMSARAVADKLTALVEEGSFQFILANFANVDVLGHIENERAIIRAVETVDRELGRVVAGCQSAHVPLVVTADHGTVERWLYPDGTVDTGHTASPVPFILADENLRRVRLRGRGELADVAPTVLELLGLERAPCMTGRSLLSPGTTRFARQVVLLVLDGWGLSGERKGNLFAHARTPVFDRLRLRFPFSLLAASGRAVGLPRGTVGNSEAGHLHLGAGRRILSDRLRVDAALRSDHQISFRAPLHLLGIVSFYSSHGSLDHLLALLRLAEQKGTRPVYVHAILGRRGEKPESGARYVALVERELVRRRLGQVASVIGRFWALDREENWDRVQKAYRLLVEGVGRPVGKAVRSEE